MEDEKNLHMNHDKHSHHCDCGHDHHHNEEIDMEDLICDLDPNKICDNCMQCLDTFNTDGKGYVSIGIDGVDASNGLSLDDLYKMYGLDDEE